jgi:hypothetical protein
MITLPEKELGAMGWKDGDNIEVGFSITSADNVVLLKNRSRPPVDNVDFNMRMSQPFYDKLEEKIKKKVLPSQRVPKRILEQLGPLPGDKSIPPGLLEDFYAKSGTIICSDHELSTEELKKHEKGIGKEKYLNDRQFKKQYKDYKRMYPMFNEQLNLYRFKLFKKDLMGSQELRELVNSIKESLASGKKEKAIKKALLDGERSAAEVYEAFYIVGQEALIQLRNQQPNGPINQEVHDKGTKSQIVVNRKRI